MKKLLTKTYWILLILPIIFNISIFAQPSEYAVSKYRQNIITVGGSNADIQGYSSDAVQIALDAIKARGEGTVKLNPGKFLITGPLRISSGTLLTGSGTETILQKCDGFKTKISSDIDSPSCESVVEDASGFKVGMGIMIFDDSNNQTWAVSTAKITSIKGNKINFDRETARKYSVSKNGIVSNGCSIIEGMYVIDVKITDLTIEGNKETNDYINGCRGGGIYFYNAKSCLLENIKVNGFSGDSYSWQITQNISIKNCEASNAKGIGFHPGSGSYYTVLENCSTHHNSSDGIYLCWMVQYGIFKNNKIHNNGQFGISIGYKDTDNTFLNNHIYESARHGVNFREKTEELCGHRNTFKNNIIENNGMSQESYGFYIGGLTHDIVIENNTISSSEKGNQKAAVWIGKETSKITIINNKIVGHRETIKE